MLTALPPDRLRQISDIKWDRIDIDALVAFEAGFYAHENDDAFCAKSTITVGHIRLGQDMQLSSSEYVVFRLPSSTNLTQRPQEISEGPTHYAPILTIAFPRDKAEELSHFPAASWAQEAIQIEHSGRRDKALDIVFREVDCLLRNGEFDKCNVLLERLNVEQFSTSLLLAFLSITLAANDALPARRTFFSRVEERLKGHTNRAKLLSGLKGVSSTA